ncbi:MAG: biopolymer transporter ExbD [Candidatus Baltobacteraceae bacterium]
MDGEFAEINVTPFADVLLVLLVIFMILAALVVGRDSNANCPATALNPRRPPRKPR